MSVSSSKQLNIDQRTFSYKENKDDPHSKALENKIQIIKDLDLSQKLVFLEVINKIQKLVDLNNYTAESSQKLIQELNRTYVNCLVLMEDPETGKSTWVKPSKNFQVSFVDEIAYQASNRSFLERSYYTSPFRKILPEIDPLFTPKRGLIWDLLFQFESALCAAQNSPSDSQSKIVEKLRKEVNSLMEQDDLLPLLEMWEAREGNPEVLKSLRIDLNYEDNGGWTPIFRAIQKDNNRALKMMIKMGVEVDQKANKNYYYTPLIFAAENGLIESVDILIQAGANVKDRNSRALFLAAQNNKTSTMQALITAGAEMNVGVPHTPLQIASEKGHLAAVRVLIAAKADLNATDNRGRTALARAVENGHTDIVNELIQAGADINTKTEGRGQTPLETAAEEKHPEIVHALLTAGAYDLKKEQWQQEKLFFYAASNLKIYNMIQNAARGAYERTEAVV